MHHFPERLGFLLVHHAKAAAVVVVGPAVAALGQLQVLCIRQELEVEVLVGTLLVKLKLVAVVLVVADRARRPPRKHVAGPLVLPGHNGAFKTVHHNVDQKKEKGAARVESAILGLKVVVVDVVHKVVDARRLVDQQLGLEANALGRPKADYKSLVGQRIR